MKILSVALFLVVSLNVANAQSFQGTTDFTTAATALSFTLTTGTDGKVQYEQIVEDSGVFLATNEMSAELAEVVKALREENANLESVSDKEIVKQVLRYLKH